MTSHIIYLLIAFLFGGAISFIVWGWSYHQHKKAWRLEYRRLTGGVWAIYCRLVGCQGVEAIRDDYKERFKLIVKDMQKLHKGDE